MWRNCYIRWLIEDVHDIRISIISSGFNRSFVIWVINKVDDMNWKCYSCCWCISIKCILRFSNVGVISCLYYSSIQFVICSVKGFVFLYLKYNIWVVNYISYCISCCCRCRLLCIKCFLVCCIWCVGIIYEDFGRIQCSSISIFDDSIICVNCYEIIIEKCSIVGVGNW